MDYESAELSDLLQNISQNIVGLRKKLGMTQDELAFKAGIDRTYMGYIENAKHNITLGMLIKIASALETSIQDLTSINQEIAPINRLNFLFNYIREYQKLAKHAKGINDVFQNSGGKLLQVLLVTGLAYVYGSEENYAIDNLERKYAIRFVNKLQTTNFSTHNHLNPKIINSYREVDWIFAVYQGIELVEIYLLTPECLESYYSKWEKKWHEDGSKDLNNPKIPLAFIRKNGRLIFKMKHDRLFREVQLR
jgi:transcriptional regulator with XRE-family HTH domain